MRSTSGITIAYCSVLIAALCVGQAARAQQAAPSSPPSAGTAFEDSTNELNVEVGKAVLVDCAQPIQRVAIGADDVADVTTVSPTEIMVTGRGAGTTSLIIWDIRGGRQFFNVTVRPSNGLTDEKLDGIRRELRAELPGDAIRVSYSNNNVFLRGTVQDLTSAERAVQIASTSGSKVVNLLDVARAQIRSAVPAEGALCQRGSQQGATTGRKPLGSWAGACPGRGVDGTVRSADTGEHFQPDRLVRLRLVQHRRACGILRHCGVQPGRTDLCLSSRTERGRRHLCVGNQERGRGARGAESAGLQRQRSQLPRRWRVSVPHSVRLVRGDDGGHHRIQGIRRPAQLYPHAPAARHHSFASGAGGERAGLHPRGQYLGIRGSRASRRERSIPRWS